MNRSHSPSEIFWLVAGGGFAFWASRYEIGSFTNPGPGLLPLAMGLLIVSFSLVMLWGRHRRTPAGDRPENTPGGRKRVAYIVLVMVAMALLWERIGYLPTIFILVLFLTGRREGGGLRTSLLIALGAAFGVYLVFDLLLKQPLPRGLLGI